MPTVFDAHRNWAYGTVATAPSPATSGTSLVLTAGHGDRFPTPPFNAVVWESGAGALSSNAEVVRVTARTTDTLTIVRAQESSTARSIVAGDQFAAAITAKAFTDIETAVNQRRPSTGAAAITAYPWRVHGFGHSGATGDQATDPTNNGAIYRLAKILTGNDGRAYVNATNGRTLVYDGIKSRPGMPGVKGWPVLSTVAPFNDATSRLRAAMPDRPGVIVFWCGAGDMLTASAASVGEAFKQTLDQQIARMRSHYKNNDHGTTATTGTWTSTAITDGNGPSTGGYLVATSGAGASRSYTIATTTAQPYPNRWINVGWCITGNANQTAVVRARVDGGAWVTKTIRCWDGNMQPAVVRVQQPTAQAASLVVEVVSVDAGATVGVDWIGVEARYPPLIGIPECNRILTSTGYSTITSQGWPNAAAMNPSNGYTTADAFNALIDDVCAGWAVYNDIPRVVRLPIFGVIPDLTDPYWYAADGMHFNEQGHGLLAGAWADTFAEYMRSDYEQMNNTTGTG